ncbi:MAG: 5-formyltetrahydrofolate cyclo-ligase [Gammaproteobacteria bacterium]|nr:5-formyltetrahydrofolate cyclo-ligase [Gammaproteobacteria bacterium]
MANRPATVNRNKLRRKIRQQRRQIPVNGQSLCANRLAQQLDRKRRQLNNRHVAVTLPSAGEIDTWPLITFLWSLGKISYLPVLLPFSQRRLWFSSCAKGDTLVYNRYGILEPVRVHYRRISVAALDLVLTPLVALDTLVRRPGTGSGYYDRRFQFLKQRQFLRKSRITGLAYEFQRESHIKPEPWDIPLDANGTEVRVYHCPAS